ncbi:MAG: hypothetical protein ACK5V1_09465 [Planctomycetaceae bacterium]
MEWNLFHSITALGKSPRPYLNRNPPRCCTNAMVDPIAWSPAWIANNITHGHFRIVCVLSTPQPNFLS